MRNIIINKTVDCNNNIIAQIDLKTNIVEVDCDGTTNEDKLICDCGNLLGTFLELIIPRIYSGSFDKEIVCNNCKTKRMFFFWSYGG